LHWFVSITLLGLVVLTGAIHRRRCGRLAAELAHERLQGRAAETLLSLVEARQQALLDSIDDLAWVKDRDHRFVTVNRKFKEVFGLAPERLIGKTDQDLSPPELAARYRTEDAEVMRTGLPQRREEQINGADGIVWAETTKVPVFDRFGEVIGTAGTARDITLRRHYEQQADFLANNDPLTGLNNRRHLEEQFEGFARRNPAFVALSLDLDNFKIINDTDGHAVGDELLRLLARRLSAETGPDDLLVRLGGDEFLLLRPMTTMDVTAIDMLAQRIEQAIGAPYMIAGTKYVISISMGVASYPEHGGDRITLVKHADIAMHEAKEAGRNRYCWFHEALASDAARRRHIELRLREALETGDFELHYQPVCNTQSGEIVGAEALVRLNDSNGAPVPPQIFVRVAEEAGLIEPLGEWVIRTGLAQLACWRKAGHTSLRLAINISGIQFSSAGFVQRLRKLLNDANVPGDALELELTEGVVMSHIESNLAVLRQIRGLGVRLAVDDFGTGYSSLAYLKQLPIHRLKIDRSFVSGLPEHPGDIAITRTILHLARTFQLEVTAEGVETEAQLSFLRELGCESIQGFLVSRPCPASDFERMLEPVAVA
jgi:diguanylate cyclase (GGDEF)-like protein/PAS domain S-box-containing protein